MSLEVLRPINGFQIKQSRQWLESFTGFEKENSYAITDTNGNNLFAAKEEGSSFLSRFFLKGNRPFKMSVYESNGNRLLQFERHFAIFKHNMDVLMPDGRPLGTIHWSFSVIRKKLVILDTVGNQVFTLATSPLSPWTFTIENQFGQKAGTLAKKWSGLGLEMFTSSDNFGLVLDIEVTPEEKALLLGAVILADFIHFEKKD